MTPRREFLVFGFIFIACALTRFYQIGRESIWFDEWHGMQLATDGDVMHLFEAVARDIHPPFYFLLLKFWTAVFSPSLVSARALSAVVSTLTLLPYWRLIRRLTGPVEGTQLYSAKLYMLEFEPFHR